MYEWRREIFPDIHMPSKWNDEITYIFPNFNGTIEVWSYP